MGHFITALYNDGMGGFGDRQDVFISNNDSFRAGFRDTADGTRVYVADVDGDGVNDVVYYQQTFDSSEDLWFLKSYCTLGGL